MDISIIIVNYNSKEITKSCIHSIINNTLDISYEIIVVDNASKDSSCEYLREFFPSLKIIANVENFGFAKANNQGISIAKGTYILLLNSDTIVLDDCLKKTMKFAEGVADVGVIGCKVLNRDRTLQYSCYRNPGFVSELIFFSKGIVKDFWDPATWWKYMQYWDHDSTRDVDCISGCFLMIKKEVVDKIGYIDENYFMYYEDSDFCRRVKNAGLKVKYYPNSRIIHLRGLSGDKTNFSTLKQCFASACYYISKYQGKPASRVFWISCLLIFRIEQFVFLVLRINKKCAQKEKMLKSLIG